MKYKENEIISCKIAMDLLGFSRSWSGKKIQEAKAALHKERHQYITVGEFCKYYGLRLKSE